MFEEPGATDQAAGRVLAAFDATLVLLSGHQQLAVTLRELLANLTDSLGAEHGFVQVGAEPSTELVSGAGRGTWEGGLDEDLVRRVRDGKRVFEPAHSSGGDLLAVVVDVDGVPTGALGVVVPGGGAHGADGGDPETWSWLERFAALAAIAYSNARLITTERSARQQEKALVRAGQALSATLELREVLRLILTELQFVVPYDSASVQELRDGQMAIVGGRGFDLDEFADIGFDATSGGVPNSAVLATRAPVIVPDILGDHPYWDFPHPAHEMSGVRCWMGVPLLFGQECTGMLTLDRFEPGFYTEDHADIAMAFAAQAAVALENARSFERTQREVQERARAEAGLRLANESLQQRMEEIESLQEHLREQATRDPLTGLFNRRYLHETLERELVRSRRRSEPVAVAMIDVDHFKSVNDNFGHAAGDRVLRAVADVLRAGTRADDIACRFGGEEFLVVMPRTPLDVALRRARSWNEDLDAVRPLGEQRVTLSVGVAQSPLHGVLADTLIRASDQAMYRAKTEGRNRVEPAIHGA